MAKRLTNCWELKKNGRNSTVSFPLYPLFVSSTRNPYKKMLLLLPLYRCCYKVHNIHWVNVNVNRNVNIILYRSVRHKRNEFFFKPELEGRRWHHHRKGKKRQDWNTHEENAGNKRCYRRLDKCSSLANSFGNSVNCTMFNVIYLDRLMLLNERVRGYSAYRTYNIQFNASCTCDTQILRISRINLKIFNLLWLAGLRAAAAAKSHVETVRHSLPIKLCTQFCCIHAIQQRPPIHVTRMRPNMLQFSMHEI